MAKVNLQTNVNAQAHIEGQSITGYDELDVVLVVTEVVS